MPLVGDILMSAREQIPDMPQTLGPPILFSAGAAAGGIMSSGTYYLVLTILTPWGESLPSSESSVTLSGSNLTISIEWAFAGGFVSGVAGMRVYLGGASGQENRFIEYSANGSAVGFGGLPLPILIGDDLTAAGVPGAPPSFSSAYLPDTSGKFINNYTLYRWLNEALNILSKKTGGILDATGVPTIVGQPHYQLPFKWITVNKMWFDGWELIKGTRSDIFYRNSIVAIANLTVTLRQAETSRVEIFPQPNRTAGSAFLLSAIAPTDIDVALNSTVGWVLPYGLAMLGLPSGPFEIVGYATLAGNQLGLMTRGLGGTSPQSWPAATPATELNLRISGYRMANNYKVGDALRVAEIPDGWSDILSIYMDSKALSVQGDKTGAARRMQEFLKAGQELASAAQLLQGPVQIGLASTNEVYNPGLGGGWYLQ